MAPRPVLHELAGSSPGSPFCSDTRTGGTSPRGSNILSADAFTSMRSFSFLVPGWLFFKWNNFFSASSTYEALSRHRRCVGPFYVHTPPFSDLRKLLVKGAIVSFLFWHPPLLSPTHTESAFWGHNWFGWKVKWADWAALCYKQSLHTAWRVDWRSIFRWTGQEGSRRRALENPTGLLPVMWLNLLYRLQAYLLMSAACQSLK